MKKIWKENAKLIMAIFITIVIASGATYAATTMYDSNIVGYDNTNSGLRSTTVQTALDELYGNVTEVILNIKNFIGNSTLTTTSQTLTGGINELNANYNTLNDDMNAYLDLVNGIGTAGTVNVSLFNASGTIANNELRILYNEKYVMMYGILRINSFSRTGSNPGVILSPSVKVYLNKGDDGSFLIEHLSMGEFTLSSNHNNDTTILVNATETYANYNDSRFVLYVTPFIVPRM